MKVAAADFSYKQQKDAPAKSNNKDKKKIIKKTQKLNKYVMLCSQCSRSSLSDRLSPANSPTGTTTTPPASKKPAQDGTKSSS